MSPGILAERLDPTILFSAVHIFKFYDSSYVVGTWYVLDLISPLGTRYVLPYSYHGYPEADQVRTRESCICTSYMAQTAYVDGRHHLRRLDRGTTGR